MTQTAGVIVLVWQTSNCFAIPFLMHETILQGKLHVGYVNLCKFTSFRWITRFTLLHLFVFSLTTSILHPNHNETYGTWEEPKQCETGLIVGAALEYFDDSDDYGVTNVKMVCRISYGGIIGDHRITTIKGSPKTSDWTL